MPRPNAERRLYAEAHVARRIAAERENRGWSYDGMAQRMTEAGCAIQSSAIYKIEKAKPPRRITVDELVGFATVFGMTVEELMADPKLHAPAEAMRLVEESALLLRRRMNNIAEAWRINIELDKVTDRLASLLRSAEGVERAVADHLHRVFDLEGPEYANLFMSSLKKVASEQEPSEPTKEPS